MKKKVVVLTGAGISAESGIKTFRDGGGLWENHRIEDVATPAAWAKNPALVLEFYRGRWQQLDQVEPNAAHKALENLEVKYDVSIITQNVDDLHERAGSKDVLHLHGQLRYAKSSLGKDTNVYLIKDRYIELGDKAADGSQLRPNIVWFGEAVTLLEDAIEIAATADYFIIIGTSLQVYPAASLYQYVQPDVPVWAIDPHLEKSQLFGAVSLINQTATEGVPRLVDQLLAEG
jgi:NAD-dependent deacetylase